MHSPYVYDIHSLIQTAPKKVHYIDLTSAIWLYGAFSRKKVGYFDYLEGFETSLESDCMHSAGKK